MQLARACSRYGVAAERNDTSSTTTLACEWVTEPAIRRASARIVDFPDADAGY